jgi:uncharacterized membrane protein
MERKEFLKALRSELKKQKKLNSEEIIFYYDELIQDAVDNGEIEADFISKLGLINDIVKQIGKDGSFLTRVKESNRNSLQNILNSSVKFISTIIYVFLVFLIAVVGGSILISGGAIIIQSIVQSIFEVNETSGYLILIGMTLIGIGLIILGIELIRQFIKFSSNLRYTIIRKTKSLLDKKEGNKNE